MDVFRGRNFVSSPRTLKPKKHKKLKNLKKPKNLKNFLKKPRFFPALAQSLAAESAWTEDPGPGVHSLF